MSELDAVQVQIRIPCDLCGGTGQGDRDECEHCRGTGAAQAQWVSLTQLAHMLLPGIVDGIKQVTKRIGEIL